MEIINNGLLLNKVNSGNRIIQDTSAVTQNTGNTFQDILQEKVNENDTQALKFSKHANLRLYDRNLNLTQNQMERVQNGVNEARTKGINDSLVLVDDIALVVSVKNNTVITATNKNQSSVFTNINGAVIV